MKLDSHGEWQQINTLQLILQNTGEVVLFVRQIETPIQARMGMMDLLSVVNYIHESITNHFAKFNIICHV